MSDLPTPSEEGDAIMIFDQTRLPREAMMLRLASLEDAAHAIRVMQVRRAPLICTTAAYDVALGIADDANDARLQHVIETLAATGPTAVNLNWVAERIRYAPQESVLAIRRDAARNEARNIATEDKAANAAIGWHGLALLQAMRHGDQSINVMAHCNAGSLATVVHGTALAPVYAAP